MFSQISPKKSQQFKTRVRQARLEVASDSLLTLPHFPSSRHKVLTPGRGNPCVSLPRILLLPSSLRVRPLHIPVPPFGFSTRYDFHRLGSSPVSQSFLHPVACRRCCINTRQANTNCMQQQHEKLACSPSSSSLCLHCLPLSLGPFRHRTIARHQPGAAVVPGVIYALSN